MPVAMFCAMKGNVFELKVADAFGLWKDVELAAQLGLRSFTLEGDALIIVRALTKEDDCWSVYGQIVNAARAIHEWEVRHVSRVANGAAHRLGKMALGLNEDRLWRENFPLRMQEL